MYLTLQEFFEKLGREPRRWGKPFAALLGALDAQLDFGCAAIGGKDSMSGSFLDRDVPPTLLSFAIAPILAGEVLSPEFKAPGHPVYLFTGEGPEGIRAAWERFLTLARAGKVKAAWAVERGIAEGLMQMAFGNRIGFRAEGDRNWYTPMPGAILAELTEETEDAVRLGVTTAKESIDLGNESASLTDLLAWNEAVLEDV